MSKIDTSLMAYVGRFTEQDLKEGKDREAINAKKAILPAFKYIHAKEIRKGGKIVALDVYLSHTPI